MLHAGAVKFTTCHLASLKRPKSSKLLPNRWLNRAMEAFPRPRQPSPRPEMALPPANAGLAEASRGLLLASLGRAEARRPLSEGNTGLGDGNVAQAETVTALVTRQGCPRERLLPPREGHRWPLVRRSNASKDVPRLASGEQWVGECPPRPITPPPARCRPRRRRPDQSKCPAARRLCWGRRCRGSPVRP